MTKIPVTAIIQSKRNVGSVFAAEGAIPGFCAEIFNVPSNVFVLTGAKTVNGVVISGLILSNTILPFLSVIVVEEMSSEGKRKLLPEKARMQSDFVFSSDLKAERFVS